MRCYCDGSLIKIEENRHKMLAFIFLYIMGRNICQATVEARSTQMYYAKLIIEKSAIGNITGSGTFSVSIANLQVDRLQKTTTCVSASDSLNCNCEPGYRWSDKVCKFNKACCDDECTFPKNSSHMCVLNTTVSIKGSITLKGTSYHDCLSESHSSEFKDCNNNLSQEIKKVYSTLVGFDIFKMTKYSSGSVIGEFEMTIVSNVNPQDLTDKSNTLSKTLSASVRLETTGIVSLRTPTSPVMYHSVQELTCTSQANLSSSLMWHLKTPNGVDNITTGTESNFTTVSETTILTIKVSEVWEGEYTCGYCEGSAFVNICHKSSAVMNVALLPNIDTTKNPGFPRCENKEDNVKVRVKCEIAKSKEAYNVSWRSSDKKVKIIPKTLPESSGETLVYAAEAVTGCDSSMQNPELMCIFQNSLGQTRNASFSINIIHAGDPFCAAEGDWEDTKAGYTTVLKCKNEDGQRQRKCNNDTTPVTWEEEVSECVNRQVNNVLQRANMIDSGLGLLDVNAAAVFSRFENVTNNTKHINTFADMNASVYVLSTLRQKLKEINNDSTVNNLLESSSNLLEKSLEKSWKRKSDEGNLSLAERYLISVEHLIKMTNLTRLNKKRNVEVATCKSKQGLKCNNSVFNVSVSLDRSDAGHVKTAGFKQLENYLPNKDETYVPNSIIVSTTIENEQLDSVVVEIDFPLLKPRAKNVIIKCVSWDNNNSEWSLNGCNWGGSSNEGRCVCTHLSTFAILMSKYPVELPGTTEITYVGLSVSVISLIISIAIELTVWTAVVKTSTLYLRHIAHINISLCLLVADCCFLASSKPREVSEILCKTFVVLKHFCYLSMFFWMLCLSTTLLHQAVYLFHSVSRKNYLRFSLILGYACPLLIVAGTFLANHGGAEGLYFSSDTCWLVYTGVLRGSIHTFVIPVGIIVFVNVFSMLVVIMKLLDQPKNTERSYVKEKTAAKTAMRSVLLLTPIFGVTWIIGFLLMIFEPLSGVIAYVVNYAFTLLNAFQGLFILLTTCLGDKLTREALRNRLKKNAPASISESSTKLESTWKK
ncbi:adhesion G-protein coupled receptor F3 [Xiphias gladius]|uniref:adhesion G-protein coupled receptor F3 n=1 Tax=Xiphias gladius TaxID=8245 RepID=UPI001A98DE07|nr:adhesion G-protein coupled receptor F3 [Xiphias gladius]